MVVGSRVRLRSASVSDLPRFLRWFNDPAVVRFLDLERPVTEADERAWLHGLSERPDLLVLVIERLHDGHALGTIGLSAIDRRHGTAELGLTIGEPSEWGKGYGTDAVQAMLAVAFGSMGLRKVRLAVHADHAAAIALYARCGFTQEGIRRAEKERRGRFVDEVLMGLLRSEWEVAVPVPAGRTPEAVPA